MLRELFNERKWSTGDLGALEVTIRHRGAPRDERLIPGHAIGAVSGNGFTVVEAGEWSFSADDGDAPLTSEGEVFVPWHRVLRVVGPDGVLFRKPEPSDARD